MTPLSQGRLSQPIPATWLPSPALGAAGEVGRVAIPLPVQPVGCEGRRRSGSLLVPARGAAPGCSPAGSCPAWHPGHGSPWGRWGWARAGRRPRRCPTCCRSSPFLATCQPAPKSTVLCDLPAGRALLGAGEAAGAQGRRWGKLSPGVGSGKARVGWGVGARGLTPPGLKDVSAWAGVPQGWAALR